MTELFPNVPNYIRNITEYWIQQAKNQSDPIKASDILTECRKSMPDEESEEYFDFAVNCHFLTE